MSISRRTSCGSCTWWTNTQQGRRELLIYTIACPARPSTGWRLSSQFVAQQGLDSRPSDSPGGASFMSHHLLDTTVRSLTNADHHEGMRKGERTPEGNAIGLSYIAHDISEWYKHFGKQSGIIYQHFPTTLLPTLQTCLLQHYLQWQTPKPV